MVKQTFTLRHESWLLPLQHGMTNQAHLAGLELAAPPAVSTHDFQAQGGHRLLLLLLAHGKFGAGANAVGLGGQSPCCSERLGHLQQRNRESKLRTQARAWLYHAIRYI